MWHDANKGEGWGRLCAYLLSLPHISYITIAILQLSIHLHSNPIYAWHDCACIFKIELKHMPTPFCIPSLFYGYNDNSNHKTVPTHELISRYLPKWSCSSYWDTIKPGLWLWPRGDVL